MFSILLVTSLTFHNFTNLLFHPLSLLQLLINLVLFGAPGRRLNGFSFGDEKVVYPGHNYDYLDDSPLSQTSPRIFSPRVFSPRDAGIGCFSVSSDGIDRIQYQKLQRRKSKKFGMYESSYDRSITGYQHKNTLIQEVFYPLTLLFYLFI